MASTISAGTTTSTALNMSGDTSGSLILQTNGTTALTISSAQAATFAGAVGVNGILTAPTAASGTNTTQVATTAFAYGTVSANINGYVKLPSGLICQWGSYVGSGATSYSATLPITFPTGTFFGIACNGAVPVNTTAFVGVNETGTTSTITLNPSNTSLIRINYMVWGY